MELKFNNARAILDLVRINCYVLQTMHFEHVCASEEDALARAYPRVTNSQDEFARSTVGPAFYFLLLLHLLPNGAL